jgi:hypothetical protein
MMGSFMKLAKSNTNKNLETCGILAGSLVSAIHFSFFLSSARIGARQVGVLKLIYASNVEFSFHINFLGSVHIYLS